MIDGTNPEGAISTRELQEELVKWWGPYEAGTEMRWSVPVAAEENGSWRTFDEADKVLEVCLRKMRPSSMDQDAYRIHEKLLVRDAGCRGAKRG